MGRLSSLRTLTTCALVSLGAPAVAAEITRVESSAEPDKPFGVDLGVRWDRDARRSTITREGPGAGGTLVDATELKYQQNTNSIVARLAVGLYHDLELNAELPYVLRDEHSWSNAVPAGSTSSILANTIDANGQPCPGGVACPIFPVPAAGGTPVSVYHGGKLGDLRLGLRWGILSDRRDDTKPAWILGVDVTLPTAALYDPTTARQFQSTSNQAPLGHKIWSYDFYTAFSKRLGPVDPYFRTHFQVSSTSSSTYSNCDHAAELAAAAPPQMNSYAAANCANSIWSGAAGAKPPWIFGMTFGTELVAYQDGASGEKVSFDIRVSGDYHSESRWYNELTDSIGKLLWTGPYGDAAALAGFYLHASHSFVIRATAAYRYETPHFLTGESLGRYGSDPTLVVSNPQQVNPNFDFRYDVPGSRFRVTDSTVFELSVGAELAF